jgi:phosphoglycolate phosphatase
MWKRLLTLYRGQLSRHTRLFEGGDEMLTELERRGLRWGIVTNKPGWLTEPLLSELKLHSRTRALVSGDTFPERKPHPRGLLHAAEVMGVAPAECVYVGDAERDAQAAQAAGMYSLIAGFGYLGDDDDAGSWFQHGWLHTPLDLLTWLDGPRARSATA